VHPWCDQFTDDAAGVQAVLETLGLRTRINADGGGWVDMVLLREG
jgi:hypothetical protein